MMIPKKLRRLLKPARPTAYRPDEYWENRAEELIDIYDRPETWAARGWMRGDVEELVVPAVLREQGAKTVVVAGAGSGRQYGFLSASGFEVRGFDISPSLVAACRTRYPEISTHPGSVVDADQHETACDAVVTSAVLQHVPPAEIGDAVESLKRLAQRAFVIRELVYLSDPSTYQFAHNYDALFEDWDVVHREITDDRPAARVALIAWRRRAAS